MKFRTVSIPKPEIAAMARNYDLDSIVETDSRQSLNYILQDETTFNTPERQIAGGTRTFEQQLTPEFPREQNQLQLSSIQESNQIARAYSDASSNHVVQESSPCSSTEVQKEALVPSNSRSEWRKKRENPNMEAASGPDVVQTQQNYRPSGIYMQESNDGFGQMSQSSRLDH